MSVGNIQMRRLLTGWPARSITTMSRFTNGIFGVFLKTLALLTRPAILIQVFMILFGLDINNQACTTNPPNSCNICGNLCSDYLQRLWKIDDFKELDPSTLTIIPVNSILRINY